MVKEIFKCISFTEFCGEETGSSNIKSNIKPCVVIELIGSYIANKIINI